MRRRAASISKKVENVSDVLSSSQRRRSASSSEYPPECKCPDKGFRRGESCPSCGGRIVREDFLTKVRAKATSVSGSAIEEGSQFVTKVRSKAGSASQRAREEAKGAAARVPEESARARMAASRFLKSLTASDPDAIREKEKEEPDAAADRQARYEAMKTRIASRQAKSKATSVAAASPPTLSRASSRRVNLASSMEGTSESGSDATPPGSRVSSGSRDSAPKMRKWAARKQLIDSNGMSISDVEEKYKETHEATLLSEGTKAPPGTPVSVRAPHSPADPTARARKYQSLRNYSPDNLDYLKAQTELLALQSKSTSSGADYASQVEEQRKARQREAAAASSIDITTAVKTRPDRYKRLMERRQQRSSQYGGAHSHATAEQRVAVLSAQEALLKLKEAQLTKVGDELHSSGKVTAADDTQVLSASPGKSDGDLSRARSQSVASGHATTASKILLEQVSRAKASELSLVEELEAVSLEDLARSAIPDTSGESDGEGYLGDDALDDSSTDAQQSKSAGPSTVSSPGESHLKPTSSGIRSSPPAQQGGGSTPSMAKFVRAPPKRFQRLLEVRQEQIASSGGAAGGMEEVGVGANATGKSDVSVEQFASLRSLEAYYKGLGAQGSAGGSRRGTTAGSGATVGGIAAPPMGKGPRARGPAFAGLSTLASAVDEVDEDGDTPLHQAAYDGQIKVVKYLVTKGADVNARNVFDETPLFVAVMNNQLEVVQYLCQQGADLDTRNLEGVTPRDAAEGDVALWLEHYVARRANALRRSDPEKSLAESSASGVLNPNGTSGKAARVRRGKVVKTQQQKDEELLDAAQTGMGGEVTKLLAEGANPNYRDEEDETCALHHTAFDGNVNTAVELLEAGADLEARDADECTPLHWAAESDEVDMARELLKRGAAVNARTGSQGTALHTALHANSIELVELLLEYKADVHLADEEGEEPIHAATIAGSGKALRLLLDRGAQVNKKGAKGGTPLHLACSRDELSVVQFLLERGADPKAVDADGETPLHWLCTANMVEEMTLRLMRMLIKAGADVNQLDSLDEGPLHVACREGQHGLARFLVRDAGADVNVANRDGWTPLHFAASEGNLEVVELLVAQGAEIDAREGSGETPFHFACYEDNLEVARFLYAKGASAYRMILWAETTIASRVAKWIEDITPVVREKMRKEAEMREAKRKAEQSAKAAELKKMREATAANKQAFETTFAGGEAAAGLPTAGKQGPALSASSKGLARLASLKAAQAELAAESRVSRDTFIALCALGVVVVAVVWRYSAIMAVVALVLVAAGLFAKQFLDQL